MHYKYLTVRIEDRVGWLENNYPPINAFNRKTRTRMEINCVPPNLNKIFSKCDADGWIEKYEKEKRSLKS